MANESDGPKCPVCGDVMSIGAVCKRTLYGLMRCKPSDEGAVHVRCT